MKTLGEKYNFHLKDFISEGTFGQCFEGKDLKKDKKVFIK